LVFDQKHAEIRKKIVDFKAEKVEFLGESYPEPTVVKCFFTTGRIEYHSLNAMAKQLVILCREL
jgi:hypothetical protein